MKMGVILVSCVVTAAVAAACRQSGRGHERNAPDSAVERDDGAALQSPTHPLTIMVLTPGEGRTKPMNFDLPTDYGFFTDWPKAGDGEFYLYNRPSHSITYSTDFEKFLSGLRQFPAGETVAWVETCTVPRSKGMPRDEQRQLHALLKEKGFRLHTSTQWHFVVCTCEGGYELLTMADNPNESP